MQDKEFDQLFRDKFKDARLEPSSNLWGKIETELKPKKKESPRIFWIAAAAALVLMAAGLLFTKTEKVRLQGNTPVAKNIAAPASISSTVAEEVLEVQQAYTGTPLVIAPSIDVNYPSEASPAKADKKKPAAVQPIEDNTSLSTIQKIMEEPKKEKDGWQSDAIVVANVHTESTVTDPVINENDQAQKRGIRNVGDLVNYVVDRVDRRENKILKFNTDDDDNSSLVAINIGFIKFNSKKQK